MHQGLGRVELQRRAAHDDGLVNERVARRLHQRVEVPGGVRRKAVAKFILELKK